MAWPFVRRSSFDALKDERDTYRMALTAIANSLARSDDPEDFEFEVTNILHLALVKVYED